MEKKQTTKPANSDFLELRSFDIKPLGRVASDVNLGLHITLEHAKGQVDFLMQPADARELIRRLALGLDRIK